jgi:hypothetical protein
VKGHESLPGLRLCRVLLANTMCSDWSENGPLNMCGRCAFRVAEQRGTVNGSTGRASWSRGGRFCFDRVFREEGRQPFRVALTILRLPVASGFREITKTPHNSGIDAQGDGLRLPGSRSKGLRLGALPSSFNGELSWTGRKTSGSRNGWAAERPWCKL